MTIKNKEIIEEGVKLFNSIRALRIAISSYFSFKMCYFDDHEVQNFSALSKPQITFLSELWNDPKYSDPYKKDPCVIIETNTIYWCKDYKHKHHTID